MRCLIDIRPLLGSHRAGVGQYTYHLTKELLGLPSVANRQYSLFAPGWNRSLPSDLPKPSDQVEYCQPKISNRAINILVGLTNRPLLEQLVDDFDIAWMPNINFSSTKRPYTITAHDLSFVRFPEFFSAKQRLWHAMAKPKRLFKKAAHVIAVSEHTKIDLNEIYKIPEDKITVISPAAGPEYKPASQEEQVKIQQKYDLPKKYFLFLGTIEPRKNIDGLIDAFSHLNTDAHLVIAGGKGWLWQNTFKQAEMSPAKDRIKFLDYVDEADKPALYSSALALTYPSFYEGFGMPPLEAMSCGCPVITSFASSLGEVVADSGLLIDPHDLNELTEAMRLILEEQGLRENLIEKGLQQAKRFSWQKSAEKLDRVLEEIKK